MTFQSMMYQSKGNLLKAIRLSNKTLPNCFPYCSSVLAKVVIPNYMAFNTMNDATNTCDISEYGLQFHGISQDVFDGNQIITVCVW